MKTLMFIAGLITGAVFAPLVYKYVIPYAIVALNWIVSLLQSIPAGG